MTRKQIDNITFSEALKVLEANNVKVKIDFNTKDSDIKSKAREILRDQKKRLNQPHTNKLSAHAS